MTVSEKSQPLGLYLHIPWCARRCIYCDFNTYLDEDGELKKRYHAALLKEISEVGAALGRPSLDTIFIGGGTPTTLAPAQLVELVQAVQSAFALRPAAEVTVEANPGTVSTAYLREIWQGGINRLSLGVQSLQDDELRFLSRLHNAAAARRAVEQARQAGFDNLNLDLMFNLPGQSPARWRHNLTQAIELAPEHFSLYSLIVEPGTPLHRQVNQGQVPEPDDEVAAEMYAAAIELLRAAGYAHYEISNWARAGGEPAWESPRLAAAHNLIYWRNQPYLGLGAGAFGTFQGQRWTNVKRPQRYVERVERGQGLGLARAEESLERIDRTTAMQEHMLLGLRLVREGVSLATFEARFGLSLTEAYPQAVSAGLERGLTKWVESPDGRHLRLTHAGRFLANQAIIEFIGG
jgi:oxygen-independent coproporphyrinogen-3 oxidase